MKTQQQGFVGIAALIALIVALIIGGAYVVLKQTTPPTSSCVLEGGQYGAPESTKDLCCPGLIKQSSSESSSGTWGTCIKPKNQTSEWKKYSNASISFDYPSILSVKQDGEIVTLSHSVPYLHPNPCDFKGGASPLDRLTDFSISLKVVNRNLKELAQSTEYPGWDYVSKNPFKSGSWNGFKIQEGVEGCGKDVYYLTVSPTQTLVIDRPLITEFLPIISNYQTYLNLPGIITPSQGEGYFTKILSSLKVAPVFPVANEPLQVLTAGKILNSNGFVDGRKKTCEPRVGDSDYCYVSEYITKDIIFGDLDNDGQNEAVAKTSTCGASCGASISVFKLVEGEIETIVLPGSGVSGAAQNISSLAITSDGLITATVTDGGGTRLIKNKVGRFRGVLMVLPLTQ